GSAGRANPSATTTAGSSPGRTPTGATTTGSRSSPSSPSKRTRTAGPSPTATSPSRPCASISPTKRPCATRWRRPRKPASRRRADVSHGLALQAGPQKPTTPGSHDAHRGFLLRRRGLVPPRELPRQDLKLVRLRFRHLRRGDDLGGPGRRGRREVRRLGRHVKAREAFTIPTAVAAAPRRSGA